MSLLIQLTQQSKPKYFSIHASVSRYAPRKVMVEVSLKLSLMKRVCRVIPLHLCVTDEVIGSPMDSAQVLLDFSHRKTIDAASAAFT